MTSTSTTVTTTTTTTGAEIVPVTKGQLALPADAYAIVGDPLNAATWKLPLWKDAGGDIAPAKLSAALGHVAKMDVPSRVRVANAYAECYPDRRLPDALAEAIEREAIDAFTDRTEPTFKAVLEPSTIPVMYRVAKALSPALARDDLMAAVGEMQAPAPEEQVGCMIALGLPSDLADALAVEAAAGLDVQDPADMHVTLAYVPLPPGAQYQALELAAAAMRAACLAHPFEAEIGGYAIFVPDPDEPGDDGWYTAVALVDCAALTELRADLIERLEACGLPVDTNTHGFTPHITLATAKDGDLLRTLPLPAPTEWVVDSMCVAIGGVVQHFPLIGGWGQTVDESYGPVAMSAVAKSDDAKRYTLAPLYVPGRNDSWGEWMEADDLQQSQWDYVRNADRVITLQHQPDIPAGEWVDLVSWPFPVRCDLVTGDGVTKSVELPANTVYMGVVWEEWAYKLARDGHINGISLEGFALKTDEPVPV